LIQAINALLLLLAYPVAVYWGIGHLEPRWILLALGGLVLARRFAPGAMGAASFGPRRMAARVPLFADAGHPVFDGHFPQQAPVPGFVPLDRVITLAREAFGLGMPVLRLEQLRFQAPRFPDTAVVLAQEWDAPSSLLGFRITSADLQHAGGRVRFGLADV
jgi:hypothetical protein